MVSQVICFDGPHRYASWIKRHPQYSRYSVVSLSQPLAGATEDSRREFLSAYVDCVGRLSVHNHSLLWWACDISSKNRFLSPLVQPLEQFFKSIHLIKKSNEDVLILVDVPFLMMRSLQKALLSHHVPCTWHGQRSLPVLVILREWALRGGRIIGHLFYIIPRIIKARRSFGSLVNEKSKDKTPAYLIRTFISARSFDTTSHYKDLFFGSLPDFLSEHSRIIILADVMDDFSKTLDLMKRFGEGRLYPLEAFMTITDVLKASLQMAAYKIRVPQPLDLCSYDISDLVRQICKRQGSKIQPLQLYQYRMMKRFLEKFSIRDVLLTCEFNPWEKMCIWALREVSPAVKILGYQHTVVPQASANMFVSRLEQEIIPRPDLILTVGQKPKDIIARYETCAPSKIKTSCGLRFEYLFKQAPPSSRQRRGHVLLALEGLPQAVDMTNYVLQQWPSCKSYQLRIRTHVVLPLEKIKSQLIRDPAGMPQVEISTGSLQDDLSWADIVIYWGSTVALEALIMGKPVVHYDNGSLLSFDPLFELNDFKWRVTRSSALPGVLDEISNLPDVVFEEKRQKAKAYITSYFHPVTFDTMRSFLEPQGYDHVH